MSELDRLLSIVVDVESLFMSIHNEIEPDPDVKQAYFYLFKVLSISFEYHRATYCLHFILFTYFYLF